jgi:hypothetical protein
MPVGIVIPGAGCERRILKDMRFAGLVALMVAMVLGIVLAARGEASWSARSLPVTSAAIESLVGDSQVTFSPPTGSPKVTADQAIAAAEGQLLDAKDQASSIVATLADVTDPIANADGLLAYDVRIEV